MATASAVRTPRLRGFLGIVPYLFDIIVPLVSYYVFTGLGLTPFWALVIGGGITSVIALLNTVRRGKLDKLGVLVILEIALGLTLDLTVRDARLTLARASLFILVAGVWVFVNTFSARPLTVDVTKGFAAKKGGRPGIDAFEWLAVNSQPFMTVQRRLSMVWSLSFIAYALLRVVVIYNMTISQAVWVNEFPGIIAVILCLIASAREGKKLEAMVYARMAEMAQE